MKTSAYKVKALLILVFISVMPVLRALPEETEYPGTIIHSGFADDRRWGAFPIGFDFDFFGDTYSEFHVNSNCLVMFGAHSNAFNNLSIPNATKPDNFIAAFWDDLVVDATGDIMYQSIGTAPNRKLIIQFNNMTFWGSDLLLGTIQVILYEGSNNIQIQYRNIVDLISGRAGGNSATIGLENLDATDGVLSSYNTPGFVYSGRAILYTPSGGSYTEDNNAIYDGLVLVDAIPRPGIAKLVSPSFGSTVSDSVTFQWEVASNASSYYVVISHNSDLSGPIHTSADLTDLSYQYTLSPNNTYYWSTYTKNSEGRISWSEIWSFHTSATPPLLAVPRTVHLELGDTRLLPLVFTGGDAGSKTASVSSLPTEGILYQNNGGLPGAEINSVPADVTDLSFSLFYTASGAAGNGVGNFEFHFSDATGTSADETYTVHVSPPGIPNFMAASKETDRVEITFDRNMADPTGKHLEFAVEDNGVAVTSTSCELKGGDPTTFIVFVSPNLNTDNTIEVAYTRGTVEAESGGILESFDFQLAGKIAQVINFNPLVDKTYGDADFMLSASASSGLPVTFSSSNSTVVSLSGMDATVNNAGETLIYATQAGDATYAAVTFEQHQQVNKAVATVNLTDLVQDYTGAGVSATVTTVPPGLNLKVTYDGLPDLPVDIGSYTVLAEVFDPNYTGSATEVLSISDITPPVPDLVPLPDLSDECSLTPAAPTATDFYAGSVTGTTTTPFPITTQGTTFITWSYDDGNGNISTQDQTVIIDDVTNPLSPTLPDVIGECAATAPVPNTTDACAGIISGTTSDPLTYSTVGTHVITWTFNDGHGNSLDVPQNVIITDVSDPVTPTLADLHGDCSVTAVAPTTTDNCAGTITGTTTDPLTYNVQGSYVIDWTFDDGNGNSIQVPQNVLVADMTDPVTPTLSDVSGECSITVIPPTTLDGCAGTLQGSTTDPMTYSTQGTHVVNWIFDDGNGNSISVPQNVIVDDVTDPLAPTLSDVTGECSATATVPSTTDACAGPVTGTTSDPLTYTIAGTHLITWTFDDGNGNSISVPQNVIVTDVTDPVTPTLADLTGECSVTAVLPTTSDDCAGTITGATADPLTYSTQGSFVINWTFDDGNGNSIMVPQNVIVTDLTPPTAIPPADVTTCDGTVSYIGLTNVTDNCTTPLVTYQLSGATIGSGSDDASAEMFAPGLTSVSYTLDDGNGNTTQYVFTVTYQVLDEIVVSITDGTLTCETSGTYQWINCEDNTIIDGETASTFTPASRGDYAVILTQGGCSDTSECYSVTVSGIGNKEHTQVFRVYPNPAKDFVTINMSQEQANVTIKVFDLTGNLIHLEELDRLTETRLDISEFKSGLFLIQIHNEQMSSVARLVKE